MARRAALPLSGDASASPSRRPLRIAESVLGTLPPGVADSAGGPGRAGSPTLKLSSDRRRPFTGFRPDARLLIAAALLALALPAVATWALGRAYRTSETDRVDARLSASLRVAAERLAAVDNAALRS